jgi:superfamily II DNA helicase RecQ
LSNQEQTAIKWRTSKVAVGKDMSVDIDTKMLPKDSIVKMFHAGTPKSSKQHILKSVSLPDGHVSVLFCTIAFGLGMD